MTNEKEKPEVNHENENMPTKPMRKGISRFFHVSRADYYISTVVALFFFLIAFRKITDPESEFMTINISWVDSLQLAVLFGIFAMVARVYYRFFEEKYSRK
jgi:hypothetical protein